MSKPMNALLSTFAILAFSGQVYAEHHKNSEHAKAGKTAMECTMGTGPIIPDGNVASEDELVAASGAMKEYQGRLQEYRICVENLEKALDPEAEETALELAELRAKYDRSVDAESVIAEEFNAAVRAFKARQQ